ncbi:MAG TPA: DUF5329 domain-containing protein [Rhodocyclaceae bacterium]|nr:DUF5329 domain-containing protein [Rhodocyclaceae bacterium]
MGIITRKRTMKCGTARALLLLAAFACSSAGAAATPNAITTQEVAQLLERLGNSGCEFKRNGTWHGAAQARDHLNGKYKYLLDKGRISTAESFIELAGTGSSTSGTPYHVKCQGVPEQESAVWLGAELAKMRKAARQAQ